MSKIRFELNEAGVRENILNADFVQQACEEQASQLGAETYDNGYHILTFAGTQRAHSIAFPNTKENPQ